MKTECKEVSVATFCLFFLSLRCFSARSTFFMTLLTGGSLNLMKDNSRRILNAFLNRGGQYPRKLGFDVHDEGNGVGVELDHRSWSPDKFCQEKDRIITEMHPSVCRWSYGMHASHSVREVTERQGQKR